MSYSHVDTANIYARQVISKKVAACKWVRLACQRHLDDLNKSQQTDYPYYFDENEAQRFCEFMEMLPHVSADWFGKTIELSPWQSFIFSCIYGWRRKRDKKRRFREAYIEVPRKNGKSLKAAGVSLFGLALDGEYGAQVYCGATTRIQAFHVFKPAKLIVDNTPKLQSELGIESFASNLSCPATASKFEPLIGNPGDGGSPSCAVIDEYHEHKTDDLYQCMKTGTRSRKQPLIFIITTAGSNIGGPCYDKHLEVKKVLQGAQDNDRLFGIIYTIDEEDDWTTVESLKKANPNFGISMDAEDFIFDQEQAVLNTSQQNDFKTKHLNIWTSAKSAWLNLEDWNACADKTLSLENFKGDECWLCIDLASKIDICALVLLFKRIIGSKDHYYAFGRFYLPEATVHYPSKNRSSYETWVNDGHLIATDGEEIDFNFIPILWTVFEL
ncbi:terminase large subunit [Spartinivicinus poritis]|uniref:Terminase large subunit n=1 Tax=Spartinivicinus poritis TaxID=2994640 RepID=A0ABT5UJD7_9GAMM|nr:terminase large subunit [Spartinivicinus sp. A2-2]MDE1465642.1 terminase large subunit [Spartinivicinus sp. A2-2]